MGLRHRIGIYKNLSLIFMSTLMRHGPIIAVRRSINFVVSRRMDEFFRQSNSETPVSPRIPRNKSRSLPPEVLIVTHVWNTSGVPILAELISEYLSDLGLKTAIWSVAKQTKSNRKLIGSGSFQELVASFNKLPQTIFLNTSCVEATFIDSCCEMLSLNRISKLVLYSHEDIVILPRNTIQLLDVADSTRCFIFAGSKKTAASLQKYFKNKVIVPVPYQIARSPRLKRIGGLSESVNFDALDILLVGSTADNRKGHIKVARSLRWAKKYQAIFNKLVRSKMYREMNLTVIGANIFPTFDSISSKVIEILDRDINILPILEFPDYVKVLEKKNAVICLSQYETLPLYVSEAMARGCIVLRNDCGGMAEQLVPGVNGIRMSKYSYINGLRILRLSRLATRDLLSMSSSSVARFADIHSSSWDENFHFLIEN